MSEPIIGQSLFPDFAQSSTLSGAGQTSVLPSAGLGDVGIEISGVWSGTIVFEGQVDPTNGTFRTILAIPASSGSGVTSTTANGAWHVFATGFNQIRVRMSAFTSGTANIYFEGSFITPNRVVTDQNALQLTGGFAYAAATKTIPGALADHRFGFSSANGTPQPLRATAYTEQGASALRSLSSSSANDTGAGTGAQQVTVTGFDGSMNPLSEIVTLNGVTAVATVNSYRFIEQLQVTRTGTGGSNAGTITLFVNNAGGGGTIGTIGFGIRIAAVGDNQTYWAHHYIAANKTMYLLGMSVNLSGLTTGVVYGRFINPLATGPTELTKGPILGARENAVTYPFATPITLIGPGRYTLYSSATSGNEVDGSFEFVEY